MNDELNAQISAMKQEFKSFTENVLSNQDICMQIARDLGIPNGGSGGGGCRNRSDLCAFVEQSLRNEQQLSELRNENERLQQISEEVQRLLNAKELAMEIGTIPPTLVLVI